MYMGTGTMEHRNYALAIDVLGWALIRRNMYKEPGFHLE